MLMTSLKPRDHGREAVGQNAVCGWNHRCNKRFYVFYYFYKKRVF